MRKLIYLLLLPLAVAVTACGGKKGSSDNQSLLARIDSRLKFNFAETKDNSISLILMFFSLRYSIVFCFSKVKFKP